jgi:hypothetical protein
VVRVAAAAAVELAQATLPVRAAAAQILAAAAAAARLHLANPQVVRAGVQE